MIYSLTHKSHNNTNRLFGGAIRDSIVCYICIMIGGGMYGLAFKSRSLARSMTTMLSLPGLSAISMVVTSHTVDVTHDTHTPKKKQNAFQHTHLYRSTLGGGAGRSPGRD